jgi:hypothetical protein
MNAYYRTFMVAVQSLASYYLESVNKVDKRLMIIFAGLEGLFCPQKNSEKISESDKCKEVKYNGKVNTLFDNMYLLLPELNDSEKKFFKKLTK